MAKILLLESSTTNCSVGIALNGDLIAIREANEGYTHSEHMASFTQEVLSEAKFQSNDLDAIAVGKGPGSYTGLRIGVSLAKGISFASEIPIISIESLKIIAQQIRESGADYYIPMTDARRMEVYTAIYDSALNRLGEIEAKILDESSFHEILEKGSCVFAGDGSAKFKEVCKHPSAQFVDNIFPSVNGMAKLAEEKFKKDDFEDSAYFEPFYLKEFIAIKPKKQY